ncbi:N-acetyltransferase [Melissococcus plutonius]|uniref:N-acetyltransferase n=1 Tax=Melissococcus plutonius TaxID=33970 RepID=UPI00065E94A5|nr:N-acetyltransferase [Melissococcus plutonius]KMT33180.1 GCN5-like N-acetyl-transferase [Melissococcus plutonius]KMT33373.1 GCN5-like N-acetyl-transferase [Melissococcus plutonius]BBD15743.1 GNAT family acetyltransferase [Melissococcus plutonius]
MKFKNEKNQITLYDGTFKVGEITWSSQETNAIVPYHIYMHPAYQKMTKDLINRIIEKAKEEKKKIIPGCPFVQNELEKNDEYMAVFEKNN